MIVKQSEGWAKALITLLFVLVLLSGGFALAVANLPQQVADANRTNVGTDYINGQNQLALQQEQQLAPDRLVEVRAELERRRQLADADARAYLIEQNQALNYQQEQYDLDIERGRQQTETVNLLLRFLGIAATTLTAATLFIIAVRLVVRAIPLPHPIEAATWEPTAQKQRPRHTAPLQQPLRERRPVEPPVLYLPVESVQHRANGRYPNGNGSHAQGPNDSNRDRRDRRRHELDD